MTVSSECSVLLLNFTRMGDLLQTTPLMYSIRKRHPDWHITLGVNKKFSSVLDNSGLYDRKLELNLKQFDEENKPYTIVTLYHYFEEYLNEVNRYAPYDIVINITHSNFSGLLVSMIDAEEVYGLSVGEERNRVIHGDWIKYFTGILKHRQMNRFNIVDIYCNGGHHRSLTDHLHYIPQETGYKNILKEEFGIQDDDLLICFQAGSSRLGRRWRTGSFAYLGKLLKEKLGAKICLLGVKDELPVLEEINNMMQGEAIILAGRTNLNELGEVLQRADFLVTNDTGTMHIASAVGTKIIALFVGHAYPYETGPYCPGAVVLMPRISCFPCGHGIECQDDVCTKDITPEQVFSIIEATGKNDTFLLKSLSEEPFSSAVLLQSTTTHNHYMDYFPHFPEVLTEEVFFAVLYKHLWHSALGVATSSRYQFSKEEYREIKRDLSHYSLPGAERRDAFLQHFLGYGEQLEKLLKEGQEKALRMKKIIISRKGKQGELQQLGDDLAGIDSKLRSLAEVYDIFSPLIVMFDFDLEEQSGDDPVKLSQWTADIYRRTLQRYLFLKESAKKVLQNPPVTP